ncbi:calcium-binding protein [Falsiroseomonas sp. E2-1-a4]|uniref:calcium-binding protein n=1 Tax=Falsiroseomonas sp. E2-1-a4 TaxID=3239299 RepID=UPI003F400736
MIISQNTVWAAGAFQDLDGEAVEIAPGVTLRIEAGATVNGGSFHVFGKLDIHGTPTIKVILNDVSIGTRGYAGWVGVDHAHMTGGAFFPATGGANAATFSLTNSIMEGVNAAASGLTSVYVWYPEAPVLIDGNSFSGSGGFSIGNTAGRAVTIRNNSFDNWEGTFAVKNWAAYGGSVTVVEGNAFLDVGRVALELPMGYTNTGIVAENNYFGTLDPSVIASMILDRTDSLDRATYIDHQPFLAYAPVGTHLADRLAGTDEGDTLRGLDGNDTLDGGGGVDLMIGGPGNDVYRFDNLNDIAVENDDEGVDRIESTRDLVLGAEIEDLLLLGTQGLRGFGNQMSNAMRGGSGADTLVGLAGDDILDGGIGADSLVGGIGNDVYVIDGADIVVEVSNGGIDLVNAGFSANLAANVENLALTGSGNFDGAGNALNNLIIGNTGSNRLSGGAGDDTLRGGGGVDILSGGVGNDWMEGGLGNDRYVVDSFGDVVVELANQGIDLIITGLSWTLGTQIEKLNFTGSANLVGMGNELINRIAGNSGDNLLMGLDNNDNLLGGAGDDTLIGGAGRDLLTGNAGRDYFQYDDATSLPDRIVDFTPGVDFIAISAAGFGGGLVAGNLDPSRFVAHASPLPTSGVGVGQFIYQTNQAALLWDEDGAGGAGAVRLAVLTGAPALSASDFILL